jgi:NAD kinase
MKAEKIVVITKKTPLEELVERFNTREQARFYIEHMGADFGEYEAFHSRYTRSLELLKSAIPRTVRHQVVDRSFLPTFQFGEGDLVVTLGPDGLVVNAAKYLHGQPLLALNPDPARIDGVLIPFPVEAAGAVLSQAVRGFMETRGVSMAKAELNDGQTLYAVNDLYIGQRTHVSARYRLELDGCGEEQSSSGIIVSTGAGSTGWLRSVLAGAAGIAGQFLGEESAAQVRELYRFPWEARYLCYSVREPFVSKTSGAGMVFGRIEEGQALEVESHMTGAGVIFSDGIEEDYLAFNSGSIARIGVAERALRLVCP